MRSKESGKVRYAYGVAMALLLGGSAFSALTGQAGAQIAQNAPGTSALAPRPGAPMSFADLVAKLHERTVLLLRDERDQLPNIDVQSDCEEGLCGSCEVAVLEGAIDHRDLVLTASERAEGRRMMACCSRARDAKLVLGL